MSNAVRHVLGFVAGLLLTPLVLAGLAYGSLEYTFSVRALNPQPPWVAVAVLAATAVVLGLLVGSRLSPIASLIAGLAFTGYTGVGLFGLYAVGSEPLPSPFKTGLIHLATTGTLLVIGVLLLVASLFPARWRARTLAPAIGVPETAQAAGYQPPSYPYQASAMEQPPTVQAPVPFHEDRDPDSGRTREFPSRGPTPPPA